MRLPEPLLHALASRGAVDPPIWTPGAHPDSRVWRVSEGFVKVHRSARAHDQALAALQALADCRVPRVLAHWPGHRAVLLSTVGAGPVSDDEAIGRWLAEVHAAPVREADPMPLSEAWRRRRAGWLDRARARLPHAVVAQAERRTDVALWSGARRVWCHRDVRRDNLRSDGDEVWGFDVEHARPDAAEVDWVKLAVDPAVDLAAVRRGYGRPIDGAALDALIVLHAVATWCWGLEHGDATFVVEGQRVWDLSRR